MPSRTLAGARTLAGTRLAVGPYAYSNDGSAWAVTPTVGPTELLTNGDFSAWTGDNPDGWTVTGESGTDPEVTQRGAGQSHASTPAGTGLANLFSTSALIYMYQNILTLRNWYAMSMLIDTRAAGDIALCDNVATNLFNSFSTTGAKAGAFRAKNIGLGVRRGTTVDITIDNLSVKLLALASLFSTQVFPFPLGVFTTHPTRAANTQEGVGVKVDDNNYILAWNDGANVFHLDKVVAGVLTADLVPAVTKAYSAGAALSLTVESAGWYTVTYNGVKIMSARIADSVFRGCCTFARFSTDAANTPGIVTFTALARTLAGTRFSPIITDAYLNRILSNDPASLIALWPLREESGTTILNAAPSGSALNGAYSNVLLAQQPGPGGGMGYAPMFNGSTSYGNVYTAALAAAFNGAEITFSGWFKMSSAGVWTDGVVRLLFSFRASIGNRLVGIRDSGNNNFYFEYAAGGTAKQVSFSPGAAVGANWFHLAVTVLVAGNAMKGYLNGVQQSTTQTDLGAWTGALSSTQTTLGAASTVPANVHSGNIQFASLRNRALTPGEVLYESVPL